MVREGRRYKENDEEKSDKKLLIKDIWKVNHWLLKKNNM